MKSECTSVGNVFKTFCLLLLLHDVTAIHFQNYLIEDGLPSSQVYQVQQDEEGYIWFATDRGLCRYDGNEFKVFTTADGLSDNVIFGFHFDHIGRMWVYTYTGGVCYYHNDRFVEPSFNKELRSRLREKGFPVILKMYVDTAGHVWIGTFHDQLYRVDCSSGEITNPGSPVSKGKVLLWDLNSPESDGLVYSGGLKGPMGMLPSLIYHNIITKNSFGMSLSNRMVSLEHPVRIARWSHSEILYGYGSELSKFDENGLLQSTDLKAQISDCLIKDKKGNLWVGTMDGILQYPKGDLSLNPKRYLQGRKVSSFYQDKEGGYWFTTLHSGVMYTPNLEVQSLSNSELGSSRIFQLMSNHLGIYAAGSNGKVYLFHDGNPSDYDLITSNMQVGKMNFSRNRRIVLRDAEQNFHLHDENGYSKISWPQVFTENDQQQPYLWSRWNKSFVIAYLNKDSTWSLPGPEGRVTALAIMPGSSKVFCGGLDGLFMLKGDQFVSMGGRFPDLDYRIADLDIIDSHHLLISTIGNGAWILNCNTNESKQIESIPNLHCHHSILDDLGNLWIATYSGAYKVVAPLKDPKVIRYGHHEGLISSEVISILEYNDKIWIATAQGISIVDRNWTPKNPNDAPLTIQKIQINNQDVVLASSYTLTHDQNNISLSTSVLSYMVPLKYEYKMSGLHEDWIETEDRSINFSELKPGEYSLHLRTGWRGDDSDVHKLQFSILPPFWMTLWFGALTITFLLLTSVVIVRVRYRVVKRENKLYDLFRRSEQKALRSQINPHFLFNAFNSVLELLLNKKHDKVVNYLLSLSKLMRKVLEHSRREYNTLSEELDFLHLYLKVESQYISHEFTYEISIAPDIDVDATSISSLIVQPYVENALKHGIGSRKDGNATLLVRFQIDEGNLKVCIRDNGVGYDASRMQSTRKHRSLGMRINGERFRLFSDDKAYGFVIDTIEKDPGVLYKGTLVKLTFPLDSKQT